MGCDVAFLKGMGFEVVGLERRWVEWRWEAVGGNELCRSARIVYMCDVRSRISMPNFRCLSVPLSILLKVIVLIIRASSSCLDTSPSRSLSTKHITAQLHRTSMT